MSATPADYGVRGVWQCLHIDVARSRASVDLDLPWYLTEGQDIFLEVLVLEVMTSGGQFGDMLLEVLLPGTCFLKY